MVEIGTGELIFEMNSDDTEFNRDITAMFMQLDKVDEKIEATQARSKLTITNILFGLRAVSDIMALYSAFAGESVDTQMFAIVSMGLSQIMMLKTQAAVYAATPGMQPLAMMMLAMIPMITGVILYTKRQTATIQDNFNKQQEEQAFYLEG